MRDQIVTCMRGQDTLQDLQKIQTLFLQKAIDTCRATENAAIQSQDMRTEFSHAHVMKVSETK